MQLKTAQYEYIKQTVIDNFSEYCVRCIPISAFELAIKMGIKLIPYSSLSESERKAARAFSMDGFSIEKTNGDWITFFNDEDNNYERINRTIMHEIGHFALGHTGEVGEEEEMEANFFAKYALAPPPLVHRLPIINKDSIKETFNISWRAAEYALQYYEKWLNYGGALYRDYEIKLLQLFQVA